jgi:hypothetical protein
LAFIVGSGPQSEALLDVASAEGDPALLVACIEPSRLAPSHPAHGKRPSGDAALFLCDAFRCLPEIANPTEAAETLTATRGGLA